MEAKHSIAILLIVVLLGCAQPEHKPAPIMFPKYSVTPTLKVTKPVAKITPAIPSPTHKPVVKPTPAPTPTTALEVKPTPKLTPFTFEFGKKYAAKVVQVIDGDTIDVQINGSVYRIRLLGVDCPETTAEKNKPYEYDSITDLEYLAEWGLKAKEFAQKILDHRTVYIEFDGLAGLKGYYGRYLAYVYLENGTDFNALLIKNGLARVYVEGTFKKESEYLKLENYAKTHKIGLWAYSTYTISASAPTLTPTESGVRIVYIHYDAPGNDWNNPNGEYVVIKNYGPNPVNLEGWKLKDKAGHTFTFPDITLQPGESVYVYSGSGVNTENKLYWGDGTIWNNDGDTAYLYDSSGVLVDIYSY